MNKITLIVSLLLVASTAWAENIVFPPGANVLNVKDYGAKGDGVTDDSAAIQALIDQYKGKQPTFYFPKGTYLVSDTLDVGDTKHSWDRLVTFQGQSEAGTIIKLKDNAPGFDNPQQDKVVLQVYRGDKTGDAMHNYVHNLTVDVGSGNPGAVGVRFMTNNSGAMTHVTIRSSDPQLRGYIGLDLRQDQIGPGLCKDIEVIGFDYGVWRTTGFHFTLENITLRDQRVVGFYNEQFAKTALRGLKSVNKVPAVKVEGRGSYLLLIEGDFNGGDPSQPAIIAQSGVFLRDIRQQGYGHMLQKSDGTFIDGSELREWYTGKGYSLFGDEPATLRLPIEETPEIPWQDDLSKWVIVENVPGDDTAAVQAAFDKAAAQGATTVCFPWGRGPNPVPKYDITGTIRVHGSVNRVIGMDNELTVGDPLMSSGDGSLFLLEDLTSPAIVFERFLGIRTTGGGRPKRTFYAFNNRSRAAVAVRYMGLGGRMTKPAADPSQSNRWFFDDVVSSQLHLGPGDRAWLRQWNPEHWALDFSSIDGAQVWILGLKSEGRVGHITARNGAKVEVLGGCVYQSWANQKRDPPLIDIEDAEVSVNLTLFFMKDPFSTIVREMRDGAERRLQREDLKSQYDLPLYSTQSR